MYNYVWREGDEGRLTALLRELDGCPLALTIATNLLYDSSLQDVLQQWKYRHTAALRVPGIETEDLDRLTSVDFSLALSFDHLPMGARTLFALFADLPAGRTAKTVEAMMGHRGQETLRVLVRCSLVQVRDGRYVMLVLVREFADHILHTLTDTCAPFRQKLDAYWLALY
jgi:hypothetical protein